MKHAWPITKLGEVLTERREKPDSDELMSGALRIVEKIGFSEGRIQLRVGSDTKTGMILIRPGDLAVSGINAAKGAIAIYDETNNDPVAATIHYGAYIPNKNLVDIRFLWWLLRSTFFRELLVLHVPGGIKTELKAKRLLSVPVPLPPLAEQQRIVARIEELASQIEEACTLRKQAVEEAAQILFSVDRRVWPEQSLLGAKRLDEVTSFLARGRQSEQGESAHYLIKTQHVQQCRYISTSMRLAEHVAIKVKTEAQLKDNDILIACSAAGCIGRVAQFKDDGRVASTDTHVAIARANTEVIDPEYLYAYPLASHGFEKDALTQ
jgi:type I restriction enzyme S subunit